MTTPSRTVPTTDALPPTVIQPSRAWPKLGLRELWRHRELAEMLAVRDLRVRYKQALLGAAWAVLQPLLTMLVFNVLFGALLGRSGKPTVPGIPYAVSTFCALVPWQLFARSLALGGNSLVANKALITKVYFPRLITVVAPILAALVDFAIAFAVLVGMMLIYGIVPGPSVLFLPFFVLLALVTALGVATWLSALNAMYRDVGYALPFLVQLWMFVTPVLYTTERVMADQPEWLQLLYGLNPMAGVVEGFRWAMLGTGDPSWTVLSMSLTAALLLLWTGMHVFRRLERSFADLV